MSAVSNKYTKYKDEFIYPHKHCPVCTKMIDEEQEFCSQECQTYGQTKNKKQKKQIFGFIGVYVVAIVIFIIVAFVVPKK